ncbi:hypothetical protein [Hymenobacter elongatus]|uniref:Uncharacterized protein n=1 Tax=Hymenobacter elongatus TaxID=877208 RepID=A0A4Z0PI38_9BACT|nr:hypothetical protein [Hymenobacter elongatus]TGE14502.1 hypothetical protein E5J99_15680 [Hymenobacter elongatus]
MQKADSLTLHRWETPCSDVREIFWFRTIETLLPNYTGSKLCFSIRDKKQIYNFIFTCYEVYQVTDERYLLHYWEVTNRNLDQRIGTTFIVRNSQWHESFTAMREQAVGTLHHYVISSNDSCLEILTNSLPEIRVSDLHDDPFFIDSDSGSLK